MSREEFLQGLREALEGKLNAAAIQQNVDYYSRYITEQMQQGKSEQEVLNTLGDPWAIARTLVDASDGTDDAIVYESENGYSANSGDSDYTGYGTNRGPDMGEFHHSVHVFGFDTWWKKLLLILSVVLVIFVVVSIVSGLISLLAPVLVPLIIIMLIVRLIGGSKR